MAPPDSGADRDHQKRVIADERFGKSEAVDVVFGGRKQTGGLEYFLAEVRSRVIWHEIIGIGDYAVLEINDPGAADGDAVDLVMIPIFFYFVDGRFHYLFSSQHRQSRILALFQDLEVFGYDRKFCKSPTDVE